MASKRKTVITFDIDGTICKQGGHGPGDKMMHTLAFNHAYKKVFGVDANISEVKHAGSTDQLILLHVLLNRGFDKSEVVAKMPELKQAMVEYAEANSETAGEGLELLPGVEATLKALQKREDVRVGLVTGNLEPIAWMKMRALGIHGYFSEPNFGGFGSDYSSFNPDNKAEDRAELVKLAAGKASALFPGFDKAARFHIGDAPADVAAAEAAGATAVGVLTGNFGDGDLLPLLKREGSVILKDLSDEASVLAAFGLD